MTLFARVILSVRCACRSGTAARRCCAG